MRTLSARIVLGPIERGCATASTPEYLEYVLDLLDGVPDVSSRKMMGEYRNIRNRSDIDPGGKFDVIAHRTPSSIEIEHNGTKMEVNPRTTAQMIKHLPRYKRGRQSGFFHAVPVRGAMGLPRT